MYFGLFKEYRFVGIRRIPVTVTMNKRKYTLYGVQSCSDNVRKGCKAQTFKRMQTTVKRKLRKKNYENGFEFKKMEIWTLLDFFLTRTAVVTTRVGRLLSSTLTVR